MHSRRMPSADARVEVEALVVGAAMDELRRSSPAARRRQPAAAEARFRRCRTCAPVSPFRRRRPRAWPSARRPARTARRSLRERAERPRARRYAAPNTAPPHQDAATARRSPRPTAAAIAATAAASAMRPGSPRQEPASASRIDRAIRTRPTALADRRGKTVASTAPASPNRAMHGPIRSDGQDQAHHVQAEQRTRVSRATRSTASTAMTGRRRPSVDTTNTGTLPRIAP